MYTDSRIETKTDSRQSIPIAIPGNEVKLNLKHLVFSITVCVILTLLAQYALRAYQRYSGVSDAGVSARDANQFLPSDLKLPDEVSDVAYYVDFGISEAEFAISESQFLIWCKSNGWRVDPIVQPLAFFQSAVLPDDSRMIHSGFQFFPPDGKGVFDADRDRACFCISTFP